MKVVAKAEPAQTAEKSDGTTTTVKVPAAAGGTTVTATSKAVKTGDTADFMYLIVLLERQYASHLRRRLRKCQAGDDQAGI